MTLAASTRIQIELAEYGRVRRDDGGSPTAADRELAERLKAEGTGPRLVVNWLTGGQVEIEATSWIGVVRFSNLEVRVLPKLSGGNLQVLRMLEYITGVGMLRLLDQARRIQEGHDFFDLVCALLGSEVDLLVRGGLLSDYRPNEDALPVLRGRLDYRAQYLRRFGQLDLLECRFDEYDSDITENQLVAAALRLAHQKVGDPEVRVALGRQTELLHEACAPRSGDPDWYRSVMRYGRRNQHYRPVHELSLLVLEGLAFRDLFGSGSQDITAFLIDMNVVFERFVTKLVQAALLGTGLAVHEQRRIRTAIKDDHTGRSYRDIVPDLVVHSADNSVCVPVDIKYKLYDTKKVSNSDIYQVFVYAYALGSAPTQRAGIVYPTDEPPPPPLSLSIKPATAAVAVKIAAAALEVPAALDALAREEVTDLFAEIRSLVETLTGLEAPGPMRQPMVAVPLDRSLG
jgi:5-methylcytosine-specific restriction enzyme subunit McrC